MFHSGDLLGYTRKTQPQAKPIYKHSRVILRPLGCGRNSGDASAWVAEDGRVVERDCSNHSRAGGSESSREAGLEAHPDAETGFINANKVTDR